MNNKPNFLAYRSFYTPLDAIERFSNAGYEVACVFPAHTLNSLGQPYSQYPPTWIWHDTIDFTPFDKMVEDTTTAMPNAKLLLMIDLNSPAWLEHNDYLDYNDTFINLGKAIHNPKWLKATENYLKRFVEYANEKYGDRILAYLLACGSTDEWYDYSYGTESSGRRKAWREYQVLNGKPDPIDIPPESVRNRMEFDNFLRDPVKDSIALDYWRFCNESIADVIIRFADATRKIIKDKAEIGCFYGYILEKSTSTLVSCGHLAYEKVLDSNLVDFLISPGTYVDRKIGGGSGFLIPNGTAQVRGRRLLHECDQRTHTYNKYLTPKISLPFEHWENELETISGVKREGCLGLIKRTHLWWFDMWGGYYHSEKVMQTLSKIKELWYEISPNDPIDNSEIAMIVDPDCTYYVNQDHEFTPEMNLGTRNKLNRVGAPFEVYSFNDIPLINNFDKFKFVIFTSTFEITSKKQEILDKYVLKNNKAVLWLYTQGIINNGVLNTANCEKLTGIPYGTKGLTKKDMGNYVSYYLDNYASLTPKMLKEIAKNAGVTINVEPEIPVYAEGDLIAVHTKDGGEIAVTVDKKYTAYEELFTGKKGTIINGKFTYDFNTPDTALFRLS